MDRPTTEIARLAEQVRLDALKTSAQRNERGQFATPPDLAMEIVRHLQTMWMTAEPVRFIDPAVGTGSFYSALLQVFPRSAIARAVGIELDEVFAQAAARLWSTDGLEVRTGDFTAQKAPEADSDRFNLILANPPYVRHHHLGASDKIRLKQLVDDRFCNTTSGLAGLYVYFLLLAHDWLADGGLGVWLIPSEFMDVNYGQAVRDYLTSNVTLLQIHRFAPSDEKFSDAMVTSAVVIFRKTKPALNHQVLFSFGASLADPSANERVDVSTIRGSSKWTGYPVEAAQGFRTNADVRSLGDLFNIKRGLVTGANDFFILPRRNANGLGIPDEVIRPILPSPRILSISVIERDLDGWPALDEPLALIDCNQPEEKVRMRYPRFWKYLESGKEQGLHLRYISSRREPWYSQEERAPAPFVCTYMGRGGNGTKPFRFFWNKSEATAANVYLLLYPKERLNVLFRRRPALYSNVFDALNSIDLRNFLGEGRVYGGGLHKIEPKELAALDATALLSAIGELKVESQMSLAFATA
jgi:hypothetical protein